MWSCCGESGEGSKRRHPHLSPCGRPENIGAGYGTDSQLIFVKLEEETFLADSEILRQDLSSNEPSRARETRGATSDLPQGSLQIGPRRNVLLISIRVWLPIDVNCFQGFHLSICSNGAATCSHQASESFLALRLGVHTH